MDKIKALIDGIDVEQGLEKILPDIEKLLAVLPPVMKWAVMAGPLVLLFFGLIYLLIPPKEANHSFGFRTYFGMGSVEAWRFTQRIAGLGLSVLGLVLSIVMYMVSKDFAGLDAYVMMDKAAKCLLWEAGLTLLFYIAISVTTAVFFDRHGDRRRKK